MSKPIGPTHGQCAAAFRGLPGARAVETRTFEVTAARSAMGRSSIAIVCPFCHRSLTAYLWSLAGGGKRCVCGALLNRVGEARHWAADRIV